jgi:flagellin-like hook-associated protein FlgL
MVRDVVIGAAVKSTLTSIQRTRKRVDQTSLRLATGLRVNSALDAPRNFFQASYLKNTANDYSKLLDGMNLGIRTIQNAVTGIETIENLLGLAENKALEAKRALEQTGSNLPDAILANDPVGYFRLNDADGATAFNLGTLGAGGDGIYTNGVTQGDEILFYGAGGLPAKFDGTGQYIAVPNDDSINTNGPFPERTVELIFNAETTAGRQVLWEEGGTVNSLNIYIDNGLLRVNGRTTNGGGYGPLDISIPIESGVSYHVAFTQDGPNGRFTGFLNGQEFGSEPIGSIIGNHPNQNGIGAVNENVYFHDDGPGNAPARGDGTFSFNGQISDVAIYNSILTDDEIELRYTATSLPISEAFRVDTQEFLDQISGIIEDTGIRGINLLRNEELVVDFNRDNRNKLKVEGQDFTLESLGLNDINYQKPSQVEAAIRNIRKAVDQVREFGFKLTNDLNIIQIRQDFTRNTINVAESGADDLIVADQNEEGANLLAEQTREALATTALGLASQSQQTILTIFNAPGLGGF